MKIYRICTTTLLTENCLTSLMTMGQTASRLPPCQTLTITVQWDSTKVGDSNQIIQYLEKKTGNSLDKDLSAADKATCLAFERMIGEHSYWSGIIQPRWREDEGWETYIPHIVQGAEVTKDLRAYLVRN